MSKITVLGAGMVGKAIAIDLAKKHEVTSADIDAASLNYLTGNYGIHTKIVDVTDKTAIADVVKDADIVVSAVPGFLGLHTLLTLIACKKNMVDISFMPEDILPYRKLAVENNVTVITDCGVAPGVPNLIAGYHNGQMKIEDFEYMVGGLPKCRIFPFEYKAPFSPCDVVEEYTRPARYLENGLLVTKPAMSDLELLDFEPVGTLEAFNSDGLRSLLYTLNNIPNMKEKTLRYPGHIRMIGALKAAGFLDKAPITMDGKSIVPFDFTSRILFNAWKLGSEEPEFTIMRVIVQGTEKGIKRKIVYDLYDEFDTVEKISSMARTTGFTATAAATMILNKVFTEKGMFPPEMVGSDPVCFEFIMNYLKQRDINYTITYS
jgi:lysine 6-dehydrogenase